MPLEITPEMVGQLNEPANQVTQIVFEHTQSARGVHAETAISAPCFLAGTLLLRATGIDLSKLEPGQPVFVDAVNADGQAVHRFMQTICAPLGLQPFGGRDQSIPAEHQPLEPGVELVKRMEPTFENLMRQLRVPDELHPYVAVFAGMKIIQMGQQALNPEIGKAIALNSLVAGCKTVPYLLPPGEGDPS